MAILVTVVGVLLTFALWPIVQPTPAIILILAIFVSAWYGGVGPSILAALLTVLALLVFFLPARNPLVSPSVNGALDLVIFGAIILLINIGAAHARQARTVAKEAVERAENLQTVTAALSQAVTPDQVADVIMRQGVAVLQARTISLVVLSQDGQWLVNVAHIGYPPEVIPQLERYPISTTMAAGDVARTGQAVWLESQDAIHARYPERDDLLKAIGHRAVAAVPLNLEGRLLGVLVITFLQQIAFTPDIRRYLATLADCCAQALDRAQAYADLEEVARQRSQSLEVANADLQREIQEREQAQARLAASYDQLRALASDLQQAREEERRRLARELHDVLGGALTGLKLTLGPLLRPAAGAEPIGERARLRLETALSQIDETIQLVRRLATDLRPAVLDDFGLLAALEGLAQDFSQRAGLACRFETELVDLELDPSTSIAVYRVVQESLTNVARHAQATEARVGLAQEPDCLVLRVTDNGCGFDPTAQEKSHSLGLGGMRERVHAFAGELEIVSAPGRGTTVTVKVPKPPVSVG